jgi:Tol biopolymer transport system component
MKKVVTSCVVLLALILAACSINVSDEQPTVTSQAAGNQSAAAPPWADLGLTGRLYYLAFMNERQTLLRLDLVTGRQEVIFSPPDNGWLTDMAVSPDGSQIVLAYSPPPPGAGGQFGFTDLYLMPADGSQEPRPLLAAVGSLGNLFQR